MSAKTDLIADLEAMATKATGKDAKILQKAIKALRGEKVKPETTETLEVEKKGKRIKIKCAKKALPNLRTKYEGAGYAFYDCLIKDGAFVWAEPIGYQWGSTDLADHEVVPVPMAPGVTEDYQVEIKPGLFVWASQIDPSLIKEEVL